MKTELSRKRFPLSAYQDVFAASSAAQGYARQFTRRFPSHQPPRLWVVWLKEQGEYAIAPNLDFMPRNEAWGELLFAESEASSSFQSNPSKRLTPA